MHIYTNNTYLGMCACVPRCLKGQWQLRVQYRRVVCVCVYIYIFAHTPIYIGTYIFIRISTHIKSPKRSTATSSSVMQSNVCVYEYIYTHVYICVYTCIHMSTRTKSPKRPTATSSSVSPSSQNFKCFCPQLANADALRAVAISRIGILRSGFRVLG